MTTSDTGPEIWRGGVNTWECDEMGHMNVRFYLAKAMEGLGGLAAELGMPDAFAPYGEATLLPSDHHVRFLKENHAGAALYMTGFVIEMGETDAWLCQVIHDARSHAPSATVISRVQHARSRDGRPFAWPKRSREAAEALLRPVPPFAAPRSLSLKAAAPLGRIADGSARALPQIARGVIQGQSVDVFGRMRPEEFIGRVSDGIGSLIGDVRHAVAAHSEGRHERVGGAVLEYRLAYLDWPRVGDHVCVRSGLAAIEDKTQRIGHWLLSPLDGRPWGFAEAVAVNFDLDTRKTIPISDKAREILTNRLVTGHRFGE
jgi:acyl-CoA thioester hydrolase